MENITLLIADDHEVVRAGVRSFLEQQGDFEVIAEARNGAEAIELALENRPDIILMDIGMPQMDGLEATRRLKQIMPNCVILALTVHEDEQNFLDMLNAGASGYITKQAAANDLVAAIHTVADGYVYLHPPLARFLLEDYQRLSKQPIQQTSGESGKRARVEESESMLGLEVLSLRERQVLELIAEGHSNQEMASQLNLSPKTIARHRERLMAKLNVHSRTDLVKFAIRTGLINP